MVDTKGFKTLNPAAAAELVGVGSHTIRNWCDWHAMHLSPGANPGTGGQRQLTMLDIEVFKEVRILRLQGLKTEQINDKLTGLTFAEIDDSTAHQLDPPPVVPNALESTQAPIMALDYLRIIDSRFEALEQSSKANTRNAAYYIGIGFLGASIMFLLLVELARLYAK